MANTPKVYVICDQNCKFEGMTKEQIYAAIVQAVNEGTIGDIDAGFITTIKTINGLPLRFFVGEQSAYDELTADQKQGLFAIITNDTTKASIDKIVEDLSNLTIGMEQSFNELYKNDVINKFLVTYYKNDNTDEYKIYRNTTTKLNEESFYAVAIEYYNSSNAKTETDTVIMYGNSSTKGHKRETLCYIEGEELWVYYPRVNTQDTPRYVYVKKI